MADPNFKKISDMAEKTTIGTNDFVPIADMDEPADVNKNKKIKTSNLRKDILTSEMKDGQVTSDKLANDSVIAGKIAAGAVTNAKLGADVGIWQTWDAVASQTGDAMISGQSLARWSQVGKTVNIIFRANNMVIVGAGSIELVLPVECSTEYAEFCSPLFITGYANQDGWGTRMSLRCLAYSTTLEIVRYPSGFDNEAAVTIELFGSYEAA